MANCSQKPHRDKPCPRSCTPRGDTGSSGSPSPSVRESSPRMGCSVRFEGEERHEPAQDLQSGVTAGEGKQRSLLALDEPKRWTSAGWLLAPSKEKGFAGKGKDGSCFTPLAGRAPAVLHLWLQRPRTACSINTCA